MHHSNADTLEKHVKRVVDDWPPLTPELVDKLAVLLRSGGDAR